jgi:hypothetical protein
MRSKLLTTIFLLVAFVVVIGLAVIILNRTLYFTPESAFAAPTTLVADEISQGADIVVSLPDEVNTETAKSDIKFKPEIPGDWEKGVTAKTLVFKPKETLEVGMHYEISIPAEQGALKQFFAIVEPPEIKAVFPHSETETNEDSKITIVFNRPMIPLTTLGETEKDKIPVTVSPETKGRWKWISTRTLQFIPEEDLQRSSNYAVKTLEGFASFDGVALPEFEHKFFTRPLRYERIDSEELQYNQPIRISFNQPVDLDRTKEEISIRNKTTDEDVDFIAEYDKRNDEVNESVIALYQKKDKHGRDRLWDFTNEYEINIKKAYPTEGDIILDEKNNSTLTATDIVKHIQSVSDRSNYATLEFFDPQGSIDIEFYEDINLGRSKIVADKLADIEYIKECKEEEQEEGEEVVVWSTYDSDEEEECEKVDNKSKIRLTFKSGEIGLSEKINLKLEKIYNSGGKEISTDPIEYTIYSYPEFEIHNAIQEGQEAASVERLTVCTSTPLHVPKLRTDDEDEEPENIDDYLAVNPEYRFKRWETSFYIAPNIVNEYPECKAYQFQTNIF